MTANNLHLDVVPGHQRPIYRQISGQIAEAIAAGTLTPGDSLNPYRELAQLLVVSPLAVKKAYEELALQGLCLDDGEGTFRVAAPSRDRQRERARQELYETLLEEELSLDELRLAREVQCRLLPPGLVSGEGFAIAGRNYPARFVAGDFYDVIRRAGGVDAVVADVAGKGIGPSLIMATVKAMLPFLADGEKSVEETLGKLNRRLHGELSRREFVALAYARLEAASGRVRIADAGLPAPWLLRRGEDPVELEVHGQRLPLGLFPAIEYRASEVTLEPGDRLLLLTDGIPEAPTGGGEVLGYEGFSALLGDLHRQPPEAPGADRWLDALLERVWEVTERKSAGRRPARELIPAAPYTLADDWTALVIERT